MKNILKSFTGILILLSMLNENAEAFCGIGGIFGAPPTPACTCSSNKVAIKRMSGNVCQEDRCVSQGQAQHYLNQGWIYGCCSSSRMGDQNQVEESTIGSYPNPAYSIVTTSFSLSTAQHIAINLFDVNGRLVSTLADKYYDAGRNEVGWNASDLKEGVYFLQIRSDDIFKMEKLIVAE